MSSTEWTKVSSRSNTITCLVNGWANGLLYLGLDDEREEEREDEGDDKGAPILANIAFWYETDFVENSSNILDYLFCYRCKDVRLL
jgi:hypothetical protein